MKAKKQEISNEPTVRLQLISSQKSQKASRASSKPWGKEQEVWQQPTVHLEFIPLHAQQEEVWQQPTINLDLVPSHAQQKEVWQQPTVFLEFVPSQIRQQLGMTDLALLQQEQILFVARRPWLRRCCFLAAVFLLSALLLWLQSAFYGVSPQTPNWNGGIQWRECIWAIPVLGASVLCLGWLFFAEREKKQGDSVREIAQLLGYTLLTGAIVTLSMVIPLMIVLVPVLPYGWNRLLVALAVLALGELVVFIILMKTTPRLKGQLLRSEDMGIVPRTGAFDVSIGMTDNGTEMTGFPSHGRAISSRLTGMLVLADMSSMLCKTKPLFSR